MRLVALHLIVQFSNVRFLSIYSFLKKIVVMQNMVDTITVYVRWLACDVDFIYLFSESPRNQMAQKKQCTCFLLHC